MFVYLIAFLSPILSSIAVSIESRLSNTTFKHQTTMIFYISLMNIVFLPLIFLFGQPDIPRADCLKLYLLLATFDVLYLYPYYTAMKVIDTSIVAALLSLGNVIIPIMSYFLLDEVLNLHQYIGFTIIIMSSIALSIKGDRAPKLSRAFWYMMLASFMISCRFVLIKYVITLDGNWVNMIVYPNLFSGLLPFLFLLSKKHRKDILRNFPPYLHQFKFFAINEFVCFLIVTCLIYGLSQLSPVVSASIEATEPIFLLAAGGFMLYFFNIKLRERITRRILMKKLFCFVLIILGVILVV